MAGWRREGARAVEMEAATLLAVAAAQNVEAGALVIVSDLLSGPGGHVRIDAAGLAAAETQLGQTAVAALASGSTQQSQAR